MGSPLRLNPVQNRDTNSISKTIFGSPKPSEANFKNDVEDVIRFKKALKGQLQARNYLASKKI